MDSNTDGSEAKEAPVEEPKLLSSRDALEVAIEATKEVPNDRLGVASESRGGDSLATAGRETKPKTVEGPEDRSGSPNNDVQPSLEPPAEYTAEEKEDFRQLSRKGQEAQIRLHQSRSSKWQEVRRKEEALRREEADLQWVKDIEKELTPVLRARGEKMPPRELLLKGAQIVNEVDRDTKAAARAILQAKGIDPKELLEETPPLDPRINEQLSPVLKEVNDLKQYLAQQEHGRVMEHAAREADFFGQTKNAAGGARFPDFDTNTEAGLKFIGQVGSLVMGLDPISKDWIARAKSRIPEAQLSYQRLIEEAYRYLGGRVDDSTPAPKSQTQTHIARSNRAASSVPGRGGSFSNGTTGKAKTYREAAAMALKQLAED